jgi:hypothetical protein
MSETIKLSDFVSQTLIDIATGVAEARDRVAELGGAVNPSLETPTGALKSPPHTVSFDVAVFAETSTGGDIGGSATVVGVFSFSAQGETEFNRNQRESRVKFEIPLKLPTGKDTDVKGRDPSVMPRTRNY